MIFLFFFGIGIVHTVDPPSLEEDVINLVEHFIAPENTIILIAMPVTSVLVSIRISLYT